LILPVFRGYKEEKFESLTLVFFVDELIGSELIDIEIVNEVFSSSFAEVRMNFNFGELIKKI